MRQIDRKPISRLDRWALLLPLIPGAHQRVLKYRKLVGVVAHVVEELIDQLCRDPRAAKSDRTGDRFATLIARESRNQILPVVDGFGQAPEFCAVSQIV